ncbi:DUF3859 domain-containing protein [Shewanella eurypsychrophilus]|uniref:DUF3859 domain-containing protein n=1 Tax=Shewanella eurypsychrophilus TaxID=2593656 RepID=A0ABX6V4R4_9GAMM|nr:MULTISPECIES: DUF3859 domain-containing protein [Shewanella]QPG57594.2 DUF3859 domain-containing protein [Shewanella eurypsychrophilus]
MKFVQVFSIICLFSLQACSNIPNEAGSTEDMAESSNEHSVGINASIDAKGLATPRKMNGLIVGYDITPSFPIAPTLGTGFGFTYNASIAVNMIKKDTSSAKILVDVPRKVPVTITVKHPEITSTDGTVTTESSWKDILYFGRPNYVIWNFESESELVSGKWTVSVLEKGTEIVSQSFLVMNTPTKPAQITQVCVIDEAKYPRHLISQYQDCCMKDDASACYQFAWKGVERFKDTVGAILYYGRACDLGDISGCRRAGQMSEGDSEAKWYNKGCDLRDFDSCIEVGRSLPN